jgi:hypothetical protein
MTSVCIHTIRLRESVRGCGCGAGGVMGRPAGQNPVAVKWEAKWIFWAKKMWGFAHKTLYFIKSAIGVQCIPWANVLADCRTWWVPSNEEISYTMFQVGWGALNLNSTNYPDHGHHGDPPLSGNRTRYLMINSQKRWPLDHEAGRTRRLNY